MADRLQQQMEAELRASLTDMEYRRVIRQLQGAVYAVQLLSLRAPDCVQHFFPMRGPTEEVPERARVALQDLIRELRTSREKPASAPERRPKLCLVHSRR